MRKSVLCLLTAASLIGLVACGGGKKDDKIEIALVTDVGNIDDKSFNQGTWEGVKQFAEENKKTYAYYRPSEDSTAARIETIKAAIDKGAKMVVTPGFLFEDAIYNVQAKYPEVSFLLLDGEPHSQDYTTFKTEANVHCILYKEEQAGFLAGYAAVKEGYTKLGFLGGMSVPAVVRYGYGYVQGAEAAALDMGLADGAITMKYNYAGGFTPTDEIKTKMAGWYTDGTEVVFSCGGGIYLSVTAAAEAADRKVIGVDVDQVAESKTIITSAMKELSYSTRMALDAYYKNGGKWPSDYSGHTAHLGAAENSVGLPTAKDSWRLNNFSTAEYKAVFDKIISGEIKISDEANPEVRPSSVKVTVDYNA